MTKVVINSCFGGFGLSDKAIEMYLTLSGGKEPDENNRTDPILVEVVEKLGKDASGDFANIQILDVFPGTVYRIDEYDGMESVVTLEEHVRHNWHIA